MSLVYLSCVYEARSVFTHLFVCTLHQSVMAKIINWRAMTITYLNHEVVMDNRH